MATISAVMEVSLAPRLVKASRTVRVATIVVKEARVEVTTVVRAARVAATTVVRVARVVATTVAKVVRGVVTTVVRVVKAVLTVRVAKVARVDLIEDRGDLDSVAHVPEDLVEEHLPPWRRQRRFPLRRPLRERSLFTARIGKTRTSLKIETRRKSRLPLPVQYLLPSRLWRQSPCLTWQRR